MVSAPGHLRRPCRPRRASYVSHFRIRAEASARCAANLSPHALAVTVRLRPACPPDYQVRPSFALFRAADFTIAGQILRKLAFIGPAGMHWFYLHAMVVLTVAVEPDAHGARALHLFQF